MGSFNTACFVTRQTIREDDEVIILPIVENISHFHKGNLERNGVHHPIRDVPSTCYSTRYWKIIPIVMVGVYRDYGQFTIDDRHKDRLAFFFHVCRGGVVMSEENDTKPVAELMEDHCGDVDAAWTEIHTESSIYLQSWDSTPTRVSFAVMSRHTWDCLIEQCGEQTRGYGLFSQTIDQELDALYGEFVELANVSNPPLRILSHLCDINTRTSHFAKISHLRNIEESLIRQYISGENDFRKVFDETFRDEISLKHIVDLLDAINVTVEPFIYSGQEDYGDVIAKITSKVNARLREERRIVWDDEE